MSQDLDPDNFSLELLSWSCLFIGQGFSMFFFGVFFLNVYSHPGKPTALFNLKITYTLFKENHLNQTSMTLGSSRKFFQGVVTEQNYEPRYQISRINNLYQLIDSCPIGISSKSGRSWRTARPYEYHQVSSSEAFYGTQKSSLPQPFCKCHVNLTVPHHPRKRTEGNWQDPVGRSLCP